MSCPRDTDMSDDDFGGVGEGSGDLIVVGQENIE